MVDAGHNPQPSARATLVVIGGLPATGKSTIARALAQHHRIPFVRIDTIEQALTHSGIADASGTAGYITAYALAAEQLRLGLSVVVECVNPIEVTRSAWSATAQHNSAYLLNVEVVCSDPDEHRRRAEQRVVDIPDLVLPTGQEILDRDYEPWTTERLVLDTAIMDSDSAVRRITATMP
ncbi:AAA family ATPase [Rhodococcus erythropolis]|jgi:predicted kinase|uniref:AAA family ATPase n=1 Tax=Rhodococcus baikonurensis TaxID=172041 RepID=UPI00261F06D2|nr:AAA family ATPase [uncultured Rhodococcus sp.]